MATLITKNSSTAAAVPGTGDLVQGELAVNVTDKKLYTKDSGGAVVKVVGSLGNQEANAVAITGGTISGVAGLVATDYQEFISSGTWTKPSNVNFVYVEAIGGGGSGRRDASGTIAGGGGGGLFVSGLFRASDIGTTVTVTVGTGGASRTGSNQDGAIGGNSTFGSHITAYGGGAGNSTGTTGKAGNLLGAFQGVPPEMSGYYGGQGSWNTGHAGGDTIYGGAGGGCSEASGLTFSNGGTSLYGGAGGNGSAATATAGAVPGGGGGGGGLTSGAGGNGRIRVWTW
jgi:hypothetical protein